MGQLTIDTLNKIDRDNAMVALQSIANNNGEEPLFCPASSLNEQVNKYNLLYSDYQKCKEELDLYKEELKKIEGKNNELFVENNNLRVKIEKLEINNKDLTTENNELKEKLSGFIPGFGGDGDNKLKYFKPEGEKLEITIQANAYFIGALKDDNIFEFNFNEEKGLHQRAIQSKREVLIPFCDIEYEAPDANYVENKRKGSFSLVNGEFKMIEKAKISIVVKK